MKRISYHISRIGLGITFLWIGVLIFRDPIAWGSYLQPWAANLLPIPIAQAMMGTAVLDIAVGVLLLLDIFVWFVAFVGALHILSVLVVSGVTDITVRDIAILYCATALSIETVPEWIMAQMPFLR